ncbi:MAG TPA: helix-turn-helix domain-containing protein [Microlunatus sp.]
MRRRERDPGRNEEQVRAERARTVGLFRYALIRDAADPALSTRQRGRLVRALAQAEHQGPFGQPVRVSRATIDRWIRDWRRGGFDALVPPPRRVSPRTPTEVLDPLLR